MTTARDAAKVLEEADCLYTRDQVDAAIDRIAQAVNNDYAGLNPVVLCVMNGGVVLAGHLLTRLSAVLEFDYMHATRYRGDTAGGELVWKHHHEIALNGRDVLVLDDILDEGHTLAAVLDYCRQQGAERVLQRIEARAATLESSPARGCVVPELTRFQMRTWRELMIRPYRLVYRIEGNTVTVLAVFHFADDPEALNDRLGDAGEQGDGD